MFWPNVHNYIIFRKGQMYIIYRKASMTSRADEEWAE